MQTLYTIGYTGLQMSDLVAEVHRLNALLVDTRLSPTSREPRWGKASLENALGDRYAWAGEYFGNVNYAAGRTMSPVDNGIKLKNPQPAVKACTNHLQERNVILMCVCSSHTSCHRRECARLIHAATGCRVVNLYPTRQTLEKREQVDHFEGVPQQASLL